jgi:hypothetical protein
MINLGKLPDPAQKFPAGSVIRQTYRDIGDSVFNGVNVACRRQRFNTVRIFLAMIKKVAKAALDGETERKFAQIIDQTGNGCIQFIDVQSVQALPPSTLVAGIDDHRPEFGECFHGVTFSLTAGVAVADILSGQKLMIMVPISNY